MQIDSTEFGSIVVNKKMYNSDVILSYKGKVEEASMYERHLISEKEINILLEEHPEIIVIGTGQYGACEISPSAIKAAKEKNVEIICLPTPKAINKFNELIRKNKKVVGYMHVTC